MSSSSFVHRLALSFCLLFILFSLFSSSVAQQRTTVDTTATVRSDIVNASDSTHIRPSFTRQKLSSLTDSLKAKIDTTRIVHADSTMIDSVRIRFIPGMGTITGDVDSTSPFDQKQFLWSDAKNVGELMWKLPGFFWRDLGEEGKGGQLNAVGTDGRSIEVLLDGRPMNDPVSGTYNLYDLPLEFIDHAEMLLGSTSTMAATEASGAAMNFVSRSYNSYRPITKIRFVQDPKETIITDGLFAQNVVRGLNLMIGFQRDVTQGRYTNASLDGWNVRTRLRYNISQRLNISLTDFYTKANNGMNGGVSRTQSLNIADDAGTVMNNMYAWDQRSRHDVTLLALAHILADSLSMTQASLYYSALEREYNDGGNIDDSTIASFWGLRLQQRINIAPFSLTLGTEVERRQCNSTRILPSIIENEQTGFAQAEVKVAGFFTPSLSFRYTSLRWSDTLNIDILNIGEGVKADVTDWMTLFADVLWADRPPTIQELYWRDSTIIRPSGIAKEQHTFIQGGLNINAGSNIHLNLTAFHRTVKNAILYRPSTTPQGSSAISISNVDEVKVQGLSGQVTLRWGPIEAFGVMTLTQYKQMDTLETPVPDVIFAGEVSYRNTFFKDKLDAKFGIRSQFYNRQHGMQLDPQTLSYVQYNLDILGRSSTIDLFTVVKIGDVHVSISWDNITNTSYVLAPIYPMPERHFRISVNWMFID